MNEISNKVIAKTKQDTSQFDKSGRWFQRDQEVQIDDYLNFDFELKNLITQTNWGETYQIFFNNENHILKLISK